MNANALLAHFTEQQVAAFFLVLARVSPLFILAPLFSSKSLPARARTIVALAHHGRPDAGRQARPRSTSIRSPSAC